MDANAGEEGKLAVRIPALKGWPGWGDPLTGLMRERLATVRSSLLTTKIAAEALRRYEASWIIEWRINGE